MYYMCVIVTKKKKSYIRYICKYYSYKYYLKRIPEAYSKSLSFCNIDILLIMVNKQLQKVNKSILCKNPFFVVIFQPCRRLPLPTCCYAITWKDVSHLLLNTVRRLYFHTSAKVGFLKDFSKTDQILTKILSFPNFEPFEIYGKLMGNMYYS